ncbi:hypothetical protein ACU4HD_22105 [Cupriavidus basilensis]
MVIKDDGSQIDPCDLLRDFEAILEADPRSKSFALIEKSGYVKPRGLCDHLDAVKPYTLGATVPQTVRVHFETARNLYAYAWFVYRFHAVAEQQALASLEFALRKRFEPGEGGISSRTRGRPSGLSGWLKDAQQHGMLENSKLQGRVRWAHERARRRYELEQIERLSQLGSTVIEVDSAEVQPSEEDLQYDWIGAFINALPGIRNEYAHGSPMLHPTVLRTFEIVSELISQLYPADDPAREHE